MGLSAHVANMQFSAWLIMLLVALKTFIGVMGGASLLSILKLLMFFWKQVCYFMLHLARENWLFCQFLWHLIRRTLDQRNATVEKPAAIKAQHFKTLSFLNTFDSECLLNWNDENLFFLNVEFLLGEIIIIFFKSIKV